MVGVPVLGYEASVQLTSAKHENILLTNNLTLHITELTVTNPFNNGFCTLVNISIHAINTAGLGKPTTALVRFRESKFTI